MKRNAKYQKLCNAVKVVIKRNFIALIIYRRGMIVNGEKDFVFWP